MGSIESKRGGQSEIEVSEVEVSLAHRSHFTGIVTTILSYMTHN